MLDCRHSGDTGDAPLLNPARAPEPAVLRECAPLIERMKLGELLDKENRI